MYKPQDDFLKFQDDYRDDEDIDQRPNSKRNTILAILALLVVAGIWGYFSHIAVTTAVTDNSSNSTEGISMDIHVRLDSNTQAMAVELSSGISSACPGNQISFSGSDSNAIPHITLYLTEFLTSAVENGTLAARLSSALAGWGGCNGIPLDVTYASGSYGLWNVTEVPECLQQLSDTVVLATYGLAVPDQPVPSWVYGLDDPTAVAEKEEMMALYGSPNVFSQFDPHVTLAYDDDSADDLSLCLSSLGNTDTSFPATVVGLGEVGNFGTVTGESQLYEA